MLSGILYALLKHSIEQPRKKNVISVIDANLNQDFCNLNAHEIANKITVLEGLHLAYETWNVVSKIMIRNCFRWGCLILNLKEIEIPVVIFTELSAKIYNKWIDIDEEAQTIKIITE